MAPKIPAVICCSSTVLLEHELSEVRAGLELTETEDSWDKISNALLRLTALTIGSAADYPVQLIAACKGFARPINNSLNSERSRLSGSATDLLATLATNLRRPFETLIPLFVPTLLALASRSNKIFIARAKACLLTIVENCQSPVILPLLRHAVSDKSATLRLTATDLLMACLNCYNPPDLEAPNRVEDIEAVIKATARDASADVRKSSRKVFEAYKILFPSRVDTFIGPLTPVMRKYLDIKAQRKPLLLSTSTSAPALPPPAQPADTFARSREPVKGHVKSSSTGSAAPSRVEKVGRSTKPPSNVPVTENVDMPPPPQRMPSSGPVRPPPSMRQAVANAAALAPSRPLLSRHALPTSGAIAPDMTRSQPAPHGGAQRPTKTPTPPAPSPALDVAQLAPNPLETDLPMKGRSTSGPRRVPKPEPVPTSSVAPARGPAPGQKQLDDVKDSGKEREKEKAQFASSTSSSTSTHTNVHARSRPPSRLTSSTSSRMGGEKEKETRTRPASRTGGAFRPRPASRAESESQKRSEPKVDKDLQARPASRMKTGIHTRPASRAEIQMQARPESRAETRAARPTKKAAEQPQTRPAPQPEASAKYREPKKQREERSDQPSSKDTEKTMTTHSKPANKRCKCEDYTGLPSGSGLEDVWLVLL